MSGLKGRLVFAVALVGGLTMFSATATAQDTASLYKSKCVACHGADGKGTAMGQKLDVRDFASSEVQKESDEELTTIIAKGKKKMPAYESKLKDSEIKDLVAYVRQFAKK